jgi:cytochrome P450 family 4
MKNFSLIFSPSLFFKISLKNCLFQSQFSFRLSFEEVGSKMLVLIIVTFAFFCFCYYFKNREYFKLASQLPGPKGLPLFGIGLELLKRKPKDLIPYVEKLHKKYGHVVRVMIGPICNVLLTDPEDVEKILNSQKVLQKTDQYKFGSDWLGTGLFTSSGKKWQSRRKIITPAFHFKILEKFVNVFEKHSAILVEKLRKLNKNCYFDISELVTLHALDNICGEF